MKVEDQMIEALKAKGIECEADECGMSLKLGGKAYIIEAEEPNFAAYPILEFRCIDKC
jgi:hypothetical protein